MKAIKLTEKIEEIGSYKIKIEYYDNDDIFVSVLDAYDDTLLAYIDVTDEEEQLGFDINLN